MRSETIRLLARFNQTETPPALLKVYRELTGTEKQKALSVLASRAPYAAHLISGVESGLIPKKDLSASLVRELRNLKKDDINIQLESLWGTFRESSADKKSEIENVFTTQAGHHPGMLRKVALSLLERVSSVIPCLVSAARWDPISLDRIVKTSITFSKILWTPMR